MPNVIGPRQQEAWNAFRGNVKKVLEMRGMNVNGLGIEVERKTRTVKKTVYNALKATHPPEMKSLVDIAETLNIPLWLLMIPDMPAELLDGPEREKFLRTVENYKACDSTRRDQVANFAAAIGDLCRASKPRS